jgi:hypothetical protein
MRGRPSGSTSGSVGSSVGHSMCGRMVASSRPSGSTSVDTTGLRPIVPSALVKNWPKVT